ncbi:MAG: DNA-processing protein DprA, partial [Bacteroidales bacterium]|nr:DNA-processing protein DprA [Bacteroidales bacterium]
MKDDLFYTLALTLVPSFGLKRQHEILKRFTSAQAFFEAATRQRKLQPDANDALTQAQRRAEAELETAARNGWHTCLLNSPDYPPLLRDCPDAPLLLFVRSQQPPSAPDHVLKRPALGIVGTRNASHYGLSQTDRLVAELQGDPICTVSGLALGIDAQAHRSSLDYGLPTIAVVGHGLDMIYPAANGQLAQEIIDRGGAVITEMPSGIQITGGLFPRRNRIIAGLSQAVVVAEASIKGGALITARIAHSYNRSLFAFPGKNDMTYSKGCNFLIKTQMAQLLETADDLRAETAWTWGEPSKPKPKPKAAKPTPRMSAPPAHLDDAQRALLLIIQRENPADIEQLTAETGRPLPDLLSDLLTLELSGCIRTVPG